MAAAEEGGKPVAECELMPEAGGVPGDRAVAAQQVDVRDAVRGEDAELTHHLAVQATRHQGRVARPLVLLHQRPDTVRIIGEEREDHPPPDLERHPG